MNERPSDQQFIDFLYGELSPAEEQRIHEYLKEHPDEAKEIEGIGHTRNVLGLVEDVEVIAPKLDNLSYKNSRQLPSAVWAILSIAASLTLLMLVGYLTQFRLSYSDQGLIAGFNGPEVQTEETLTREDVEQIMNTQLIAERQAWDKDMAILQTSFQEQLGQHQAVQLSQITRLAKAEKTIPDATILAFIDQLELANKQQLANFFTVSAQQQEKYMQEVLNEFFKYLGDQRQEDLKLIQANLLQIKSVTDERQQETDKILSSIITTVYTQNSVGR